MKKYYAYLNINNDMVAWETAIGRINSCSSKLPIGNISLWLYSNLRKLSNNFGSIELNRELKLEQVRMKRFPNKVSRLKGVFLFDDYNLALKTLKLWDFKEPEKFISEINFSFINYSRVDSDWYTYHINKKIDDNWMDNYWSGKPYSNNPHWEIIADGEGIIYNTDIRQRAYEKIYNEHGGATMILASSVCAYTYKYVKYKNISKVVPFLQMCDNKLKVTFIMENELLKTNQKEICDIVEKCKKNNEFPSIKTDCLNTFDMRDNFIEIELDDDIKEYFKNAGSNFN